MSLNVPGGGVQKENSTHKDPSSGAVSSGCETASACENTDRHLWPEVTPFDAPEEKIFVTATGGIGINVGGSVYVKPLREWHKLASAPAHWFSFRECRCDQPMVKCDHTGIRCTLCGEPARVQGMVAETDAAAPGDTGLVVGASSHPLLDREAVALADKIDAARTIDDQLDVVLNFTSNDLRRISDALRSLSTKPLVGEGVQPSIGTKQSTDPEVSSRTETAYREALVDLQTHYAPWRKALEHMRAKSSMAHDDLDDAAFWEHEVRAFDRTLNALSGRGSELAEASDDNSKVAIAPDVLEFVRAEFGYNHGYADGVEWATTQYAPGPSDRLSKTPSVDRDAGNLRILAEQSPSPSSTSATASETDGGEG